MKVRTIRHAHLFCGLGGGAAGFNAGKARVGDLIAKFECLGGIDVDAASVADFGRLSGVAGTLVDLFDRDQYRAWHGHEPPADWREATTADIHRAFGHKRPHIVFTSPPCKGFSGLLNETRARSDRYQALNRLTLRGLWLMLEAYADDPPEFVLLENVPRIANRGRYLLDQIGALLGRYGYAVAETTHDCGELGGLAQSRKRFLLVARHLEKVPPFLYEPRKRPLQGVGTVLGRMLLPGDPCGGPMHRVPRLQWKTWVRLAFVEAGADWRSLNRLAVEDGVLRDFGIAPECAWHDGAFGVKRWDESSATVTSRSGPTNGAYSVADPRFDAGGNAFGQYGVRRWSDPTGAVINVKSPGQGPHAVADPRYSNWHKGASSAKLRIVPWAGPAGTVTGSQQVASGALAVADPRPKLPRDSSDAWHAGGHYGVVPFDAPAHAVTARARHDNGYNNVADPRLPASTDKLACVIRALDGTWHRPFTTLELAALQSLVDPEEMLELDGLSDSAWRERIGNAVPPDAATAIADVMGRTLLMAWSGQTFFLDAEPIWVRPVALAVTLPGRGA